jgi:hypothetical protein
MILPLLVFPAKNNNPMIVGFESHHSYREREEWRKGLFTRAIFDAKRL